MEWMPSNLKQFVTLPLPAFPESLISGLRFDFLVFSRNFIFSGLDAGLAVRTFVVENAHVSLLYFSSSPPEIGEVFPPGVFKTPLMFGMFLPLGLRLHVRVFKVTQLKRIEEPFFLPLRTGCF